MFSCDRLDQAVPLNRQPPAEHTELESHLKYFFTYAHLPFMHVGPS
jgi:hypothetical protein